MDRGVLSGSGPLHYIKQLSEPSDSHYYSQISFVIGPLLERWGTPHIPHLNYSYGFLKTRSNKCRSLTHMYDFTR